MINKRLIFAVIILGMTSGCASDSTGWWINSDKGWWINRDEGLWIDSKGWDAPNPAEKANEEWFNNYYGKSEGCNIHGCAE